MSYSTCEAMMGVLFVATLVFIPSGLFISLAEMATPKGRPEVEKSHVGPWMAAGGLLSLVVYAVMGATIGD